MSQQKSNCFQENFVSGFTVLYRDTPVADVLISENHTEIKKYVPDSCIQPFGGERQDMAMVIGSSKGTQPKYFEDGYWYKTDRNGYEGLSEQIASMVLRHSMSKHIFAII